MRTKIFIFLLLASAFIFQFCKVDDGKPDIEAEKHEKKVIPNLIANSSFENNGIPDLSNWDPIFLTVEKNNHSSAPVANGTYCIRLNPDTNNIFNYAATKITGLTGFNKFQLTFYARTVNCSGFAELNLLRSGYKIKIYKDYNFSFDKWVERIMPADTITLATTDTIEVKFFANKYNPDSVSYLHIDMVKLHKLN